jgi:hypothetical protein
MYSFICDTDTSNPNPGGQSEKKWYRFDDEDVSHFSPDQIPTQCFGGPPNGIYICMYIHIYMYVYSYMCIIYIIIYVYVLIYIYGYKYVYEYIIYAYI